MDGKEATASKQPSKSNEQRIQELNEVFFAKTKDYLQSELELTLDDYSLLEKMNLKTAEVCGCFQSFGSRFAVCFVVYFVVNLHWRISSHLSFAVTI